MAFPFAAIGGALGIVNGLKGLFSGGGSAPGAGAQEALLNQRVQGFQKLWDSVQSSNPERDIQGDVDYATGAFSKGLKTAIGGLNSSYAQGGSPDGWRMPGDDTAVAVQAQDLTRNVGGAFATAIMSAKRDARMQKFNQLFGLLQSLGGVSAAQIPQAPQTDYTGSLTSIIGGLRGIKDSAAHGWN